KLPLHHPEKYLLKKEEKRLPNNAFFMSYSRYRKKQDDFYRQYRETGEDLRKFIEWQRKHASN
ncbi:MAG: hypothetical protein JNL88_05425, partial [Bacteroidia bacterium]|nr:hypothetical protein [Bacteroidia bacterium]